MLQSWSISFSSMVNNEAAPGGTIDTRIQGDDTQSNYLATQISNMQAANTQQQSELVQEFANMEAALSSSQSTSSWLTSQTQLRSARRPNTPSRSANVQRGSRARDRCRASG